MIEVNQVFDEKTETRFVADENSIFTRKYNKGHHSLKLGLLKHKSPQNNVVQYYFSTLIFLVRITVYRIVISLDRGIPVRLSVTLYCSTRSIS